jgi:hypothetical protein
MLSLTGCCFSVCYPFLDSFVVRILLYFSFLFISSSTEATNVTFSVPATATVVHRQAAYELKEFVTSFVRKNLNYQLLFSISFYHYCWERWYGLFAIQFHPGC